MTRTHRLVLKIVSIVAAVAVAGLTGHFLIQAVIAMHTG
jgi:hypothetical protein